MRVAGAAKTFALVLLALAAAFPAVVGALASAKGRGARFVSLYEPEKRAMTGELGAVSSTPLELIVHGHERGLVRLAEGEAPPKGYVVDPGGFLATEAGEALWNMEAGRPIQVGVLWAGATLLSALCAAMALALWLAGVRAERRARDAIEFAGGGDDDPDDDAETRGA